MTVRHSAWTTFDASPRPLAALETPALVVDLDRLAHNLDRMAAYAALHGLALRPHVKTHKAPRVAADQMRLGAVGLTCATPRELEVMSDVAGDLLFAYPPVGDARIARILDLPDDVRVTVALDSAESARALSEAAEQAGRRIGVYVELDVGMRRVGVANADGAVALARLVADLPWLRYAGVAFYPGHVRQRRAEQGPPLQALSESLGGTLDALDRAGVRPAVVSGGSTPAAWRMHEVAGVTEVRPGTYVYNDRVTAALGACDWDDCALTVLATVVSTAVPGQAVIDAGTKALAREPMPDAAAGFGALLDRPDVVVRSMSEEHGILDLGGSGWRPRVGEQVRVVPNHVCVAVHLHDTVHGVRNGVVETSWPVAARGRDHPA
ncbi:MAG TPA: alanine racemase [Gemmatimonadaceae bacterium]|nr:alanine racemase [Gemmatimonadaceae bacterium]